MQAQLDLVGIVVTDMARSLGFYRQLGFDLAAEAAAQPHVEATLPGGTRVAWDTIETIHSFDPDWEPPATAGRISLAFKFSTPAEVDAACTQLATAGYDIYKAPWDAFWGQRYAIIHDPDGNTIDLFAGNA